MWRESKPAKIQPNEAFHTKKKLKVIVASNWTCPDIRAVEVRQRLWVRNSRLSVRPVSPPWLCRVTGPGKCIIQAALHGNKYPRALNPYPRKARLVGKSQPTHHQLAFFSHLSLALRKLELLKAGVGRRMTEGYSVFSSASGS